MRETEMEREKGEKPVTLERVLCGEVMHLRN